MQWSTYFKNSEKIQIFCYCTEVAGLSEIWTRLLYPSKPETAFKIVGGEIVQFAMRTHWIIKFDVICHRFFQIFACLIIAMRNIFPLQNRKECFRNGIIVRCSRIRKRLMHSMLPQTISECIRSVVSALVTMKCYSSRITSCGKRFLKRCQN